MQRRHLLTTGATLGAIGLTGCLLSSDDDTTERHMQVDDDGFHIETETHVTTHQIRGVNLGMAIPGHFPGEAAITRAQYDRWIEQIASMHANAIRIYTIHPPAFYEALRAYNQTAEEPLYLLHGTWVNEAELRDAGDAFTLTADFETDVRQTVDVVHGATTLPDRPGHASGDYTADVSSYTLGYIPGIEWNPQLVMATNDRHPRGDYRGTYIEVVDAPPFEQWLAGVLDALLDHEMDTYERQRPVSFTNWVTTDPLDHPYEPFDLEDAVSVDPDILTATSAYTSGIFGTYHVYPYYPDFLNETPEYVDFTDHRGEANSFAGYLSDLEAALDVPLLIGEFGVPTSRGIAHRHVHGRHQGQHSERAHGRHIAEMYEDIIQAGSIGGVIFSWMDEWFKQTWNTQAFTDQHRVPWWLNRQSAEQHFGILTFDPSAGISLDGSADDWDGTVTLSPEDTPTSLDDGFDQFRSLNSVHVTSDEAYLYVRIDLEAVIEEFPWHRSALLLALATTGRGNEMLPFNTHATTPPIDFVVQLTGAGSSRLLVDRYYDAFAYRYGEEAGLDLARYARQNSGAFAPIRQVINRGYTVPPTGETVPFEAVETGRLTFASEVGDGSVVDPIVDVNVAASIDAIELRLPWQCLNMADPSQRRRLGDFWEEGLDTYREVPSLGIGVTTYRPDWRGGASGISGASNLTHAIPNIETGHMQLGEYELPTWTQPRTTERLKAGYGTIQETFATFR